MSSCQFHFSIEAPTSRASFAASASRRQHGVCSIDVCFLRFVFADKHEELINRWNLGFKKHTYCSIFEQHFIVFSFMHCTYGLQEVYMIGADMSRQTQKGGRNCKYEGHYETLKKLDSIQKKYISKVFNVWQCIPCSRVVLRSVISTAPSEYTLGKGLKFNSSWQRIILL